MRDTWMNSRLTDWLRCQLIAQLRASLAGLDIVDNEALIPEISAGRIAFYVSREPSHVEAEIHVLLDVEFRENTFKRNGFGGWKYVYSEKVDV